MSAIDVLKHPVESSVYKRPAKKSPPSNFARSQKIPTFALPRKVLNMPAMPDILSTRLPSVADSA